MLRSSRARDSRVVLALDLSGPFDQRMKRAQVVLDTVSDGVAAVKVNHHLLLPYGLQGLEAVVDTCRRKEIPLIADLKLNDIESTNLDAVDSLFEFGFDALIANPFVGWAEGLEKVVAEVHSMEGGILLLVYMSHRGAADGYELRLEGGEPLYKVFARRAKEWGADGVIVSAKSVEKIAETRAIVGEECMIFSPGVGAQGGDTKSGAGTGADFVIVGRAITESLDPGATLRGLRSSLRARLNGPT